MALEFGKIEKLYIQPYKDLAFKEKKGDKIPALINPESYHYKYKIEVCETQASGTSGVALKFNKLPPQEFNFDFLFDGTGVIQGASTGALSGVVQNPFGKPKNVADQIEDFKHGVLEYKGEQHRPNYLQILWGTLIFKGVLTGLDIEFKLFNTDGTPLRAIAKCTFKGTVDEKLRVATENSQSPDITQQRIFTSSDRLSLMAGKIYENQNYYTDVAAFNSLDSFRKIKSGTTVSFPPLKQ
jgi:hypothetical protein